VVLHAPGCRKCSSYVKRFLVQVVLLDCAWGASQLAEFWIFGLGFVIVSGSKPVAYPCTASLRGRLTGRAIELESKSPELRWQAQVGARARS
jgi:hypothetical protein